MSFPSRLTRSQLGPRMRENRAVQNPETDVGERMMNAILDQSAGVNVIVPRVALVAKWNAGANVFDIYHQAEAWNSDGNQARPALARASAGRYTYTFAASYLDGSGLLIPTVVPAPRITPINAPATDATPFVDFVEARAWIDPANPLSVKIALWNTAAGGALFDGAFWLEVL